MSPITAGAVETGMNVRLANRPSDFPYAAQWVTVTDVAVQVAPRRKTYIVTGTLADGTAVEYGRFGHPTRFEVRPPDPEPQPAKTEPATPKPRAARVSTALRLALDKLATNGRQPMTRRDPHADPMVVKALERRPAGGRRSTGPAMPGPPTRSS
jgi:hypothetical protein